MSTVSLNTKRHLLRHIIAAGMMALYLMAVFSPLASYAMHGSTSVAMGIRECSGDCNLCGCSPESRASNTCCCSKKRTQQAHAHEEDRDGESDCCKKESAPQKPLIISCGCPCGSGKESALTTSSSSEVLPFHFTEQFTPLHTDTTFSNLTQHLTSRLAEPPDPPPQNS
jgi:hypothetical protein